MCGATGAQTAIQSSQMQFMNQMMSEYGTVFGESQSILNSLSKTFEPILAAGPNQQGFSPAELASLETTATEGVGQNYANAAKALGEKQAAEGGGDAFIPSGAKSQLQEETATSAAQALSAEQEQITQANYATGRQNFYNAAGILGGTASELNPATFANATTNAGSAAGTTANQIAQENNSWMGMVGGVLGGISGSTSSGASFGL
jgi:hypothetical protein